MNQEKLMTIILAPKVTEKTVEATENHNVYTFKVIKRATKIEIKKSIELIFEVKVNSVRTINVKGKTKRLGAHFGKRSSWKKAIVSLQEGSKIEIVNTE